jgi:hypothetical protein
MFTSQAPHRDTTTQHQLQPRRLNQQPTHQLANDKHKPHNQTHNLSDNITHNLTNQLTNKYSHTQPIAYSCSVIN